MVANIAGFGVLWVAKFLFLDQIMFGQPELDEVLSQEPGVLGVERRVASAAMPPLLPLGPDELLSTTRSVRKRLDLTPPRRARAAA